MKSGDFIYIDYIGKIKDTEEVFDTTKEDVAKTKGVFDAKTKYKPVPIVVDADFIIKGLNDALKEMKVGEKRVIEITPDKAFGSRDQNLVKLIPEVKFKEQDVDVSPGSFVTISGLKGKVISIDGGRVKVDFNHPLAGKTLEYDLEIVRDIKELKEKVEAIVYYFTNLENDDMKTTVVENCVDVEIIKRVGISREVKERMANTITKWIDEINKVRFIETFGKI
jgi:FKBP-type peptidyl-prolyl cis-trans isomerase 2